MIPLKDYNPARNFPIVSVVLIIVNVVLFIADRITGQYVPFTYETAHGLTQSYQFVGGLTQHYAMVPRQTMDNFLFAWPTFFTSMFLHGNWLHIGSNMLYLWIFGNNVEDFLGRLRFLIFYATCGFLAAVFQILSNPLSTIPMVGASGAIAGVMGAYLMLFPHAKVLTLVPIFIFFTVFELPAVIIIGYWVVLQLINASLLGGAGMLRGGGVAYFAHIGGFVAGVVWILLTGGRKRIRL
ncbi:MAG: Rhomboid family protein [Geobacteraceae bacterium]|jgi:membrane associated rhomboid family serine protease|nr:Rhomboid family protein [Geobacteraceae bacterium]